MTGLTLGTLLGTDGKPGTEPLAVEAADLTTHGVIVGMTGSGKTGLAVDLLEEALLAGIPALVLDPLGRLAYEAGQRGRVWVARRRRGLPTGGNAAAFEGAD